MSTELAAAVQVLLAAVIGWLAQRMRSVGRLEDTLDSSRKSQGERLGVLEDRIAKLEAVLNTISRRERVA